MTSTIATRTCEIVNIRLRLARDVIIIILFLITIIIIIITSGTVKQYYNY